MLNLSSGIYMFEDIYWTINKDTIQEVNIWYELWAKAGASPNYVVDDRLQYIQNLIGY